VSVFANGREISGKATPNKTIAAFPDVCLSPPSPPAGPIPIPYPITGVASDTTDGTGSVFIKGKEVGKKNGVKYSKVNGNQPATNSFGAGIVSHKIQGPLKFAAYSFDVFIEKGGAERFMDLTTQNHMNTPNPSVGMSTAAAAAGGPPPDPDCEALRYQNALFRGAVANDCPPEIAADTNQNHTVASGTYTPPGGGSAPYIGTSCTNQLASAFSCLAQPLSAAPSRWMPVIVGEEDGEPVYKNHVVSQVCEKCSQPIGGQQCHAELNILNDIGRDFGNAPGGTVLLSIDWMSKGVRQAPEPCPNCQNRIECFCQEGCITIVICNEEGQPVNRCDTPYEKA
jgi:Domain of unknown function (DUF4150)